MMRSLKESEFENNYMMPNEEFEEDFKAQFSKFDFELLDEE